MDEFEAYLAGLVATDGHVRVRGGNVELSFEFGSKGLPVLEQIALHYKRSVRTRTRENKSWGIVQVSHQLSLSQVKEAPSWKTSIPDLSEEVECHYLRGLIDGDGCVSAPGKMYDAKISFWWRTPKEDFLGEFMRTQMEARGFNPHNRTRGQFCAGLEFGGYPALRFARSLYEGATIFMPHKAKAALR